MQIVGRLPLEPNDLPLSVIVTPDEVIPIADPPPPPRGIDWSALTDADLAAMPVLKEPRVLGSRSG